jgi:hypothetical protein
LGTAIANGAINLGTGNNKLTFAAGTNSATVSNTQTIAGGTGNDTVSLGTALTTGMQIDLGTGSNKLSLAAGGNTGSVSNVNTLIGGAGADVVTLNTGLVNGSVDLGGGNDTLKLANFTNRVSVTNTATVMGGTGNDTIVLSGANTPMVIGGAGMNFITGNSGGDQFVLDQASAGNDSTITNFSSAKGDKIALDTTGSGILTGNTYDLGGAAVSATNLQAVANAAARLALTEVTGGKGGFAYQQDTGELYYSANGAFAGGGTLIGVVNSSGAIPWTFNSASFMQV